MSEKAENQTVESSEAAASGSDEKVIYKFIVRMNPVKYAKRFGVDIPDDSADTGLSGDDNASEGEERAQDGADGLFEQDAEDATDNGCRSRNPPTCRNHGFARMAKDEIDRATEGVTAERISDRIDEIFDDGIIDIRLAEGQREVLKGAAIDFFNRYAKMTLPLSTNGLLCFVPGDKTFERYEGDNVKAWAEYAIHAVTNDNLDAATGKRYRVYSPAKVAKVNPIIPDIVADDKVVIDDEKGRVVFVRKLEDGVGRIVASPLNAGNLRADLGEVTNIFTSKKRLPDQLVSLRSAAEARCAKVGLSLNDGKSGKTILSGVSAPLKEDSQARVSEGRLPLTPDADIVSQDSAISQWCAEALCADEQTAEDATVNYGKRMAGSMAGQCAATLAQCKAKNPMTCRFHGAKVIATDIENFLRQQGVQGQVDVNLQNVSKQGQKQILSAEVTVTGTKKDEKLVTAAMKAFAALPGVEEVEDGDYDSSTKKIYSGFDIDMLDPNAKARWGAGQQPPQPQPQPKPAPAKPQPRPTPQPAPAPSPKPAPQPQPVATPQPAPQPAPTPAPAPAAPPPLPANRLRPPVAPEDPGKWSGMPEDDMQFLEETGTNLAYLAQRVNHNINKGSPGAGSMALQNFQAIDDKRLKALAATDAQAAVIAKMYDDAKASESAGWANEILGGGVAYDESKYNTSDPLPSTGYDKWGFDRDKINGYGTWKKAKNAFDKWDDPSKKRGSELKGLASILTSTDPKAPKASVAAMQQANDAMTDIEKTIGLLEDAISRETDAGARSALNDALADVEGAYYSANKAWEDAKKVIDDWQKTQRTMTESFGYKEAENYYKSRGLQVPVGVKNWEAWVQQNEKDADAVVARKFGSRKGWQTPQERQARVAQLRKNWQLLWPHIHIYHCGDSFIEKSLQKDGSVRANAGDGNYRDAMGNAFGVSNKGNLKAEDMQLYTVVSIEPTPLTSKWVDYLCNQCGRDYVVELDPAHTIGGVLYENGCGYWHHSKGSAMNLISRCGLTDIAYDGGSNHFNPESAEKDFSGMTPQQMFKIMFPGGEKTCEFHPVNGASTAQQNIKSIWSKSKLQAATKKVLDGSSIPSMNLNNGKKY